MMNVSLGRSLKAVSLAVCEGLKFLWECFKAKTFAMLQEIGDATGILALRLMANRSLHWTERLLWLSLTVLSVFSAYLMSSKQLRRYTDSPTVVSLDRDYRGWRGTMPAVTLCYYDNLDSRKASEYIQSTWNISIVDEEYFYFMEFLYAIVNATASNYADLARFAEDERFEDIDLNEAVKAIYRSFDQGVMSFNPWFTVHVNPVMTERGRCYAINSPASSILTDATEISKDGTGSHSQEPLFCEFGKQQCYIKLNIFESTGTIDVHSAYEVSDSDANLIPLRKSDEVIASYKVTETVATDKLRELTPKQRKCVFSDEEKSQLPVYAKSLCLARCRAVMALEMCNCVPFFYPHVEGPSCNPAGFECLLDFKWPLWALHICNCPSTCTEIQYTLQSIKRRSWGGKERNQVDVVTSTFRWEVSPPRVRLRRDVVFSFEDLLVSFGGTLALFLGFSVLSIVQIVNVLINNGFNDLWTFTCFLGKICWCSLRTIFRRRKVKTQIHPLREKHSRLQRKKDLKKCLSAAPFAYLE